MKELFFIIYNFAIKKYESGYYKSNKLNLLPKHNAKNRIENSFFNG